MRLFVSLGQSQTFASEGRTRGPPSSCQSPPKVRKYIQDMSLHTRCKDKKKKKKVRISNDFKKKREGEMHGMAWHGMA